MMKQLAKDAPGSSPDGRKAFHTHQYMHGQMRGHHAAVLAEFETLSRRAVEELPNALDIAYGDHPRQRLDAFFATGDCAGTILYFHAGYWQSRDKSGFRFLARDFVASGFNFVLANYPLCPDVTMGGLIEAVGASVPKTFEIPGLRHPRGRGLVLAGHSAGGHVAVELALQNRTAPAGGKAVEGIIAVSGIYDLAPLLDTPLNDRLRLDEAEAAAHSPLARARDVGAAALFLVGGDETEEFHRQSAAMARAWQDAGNPGTCRAIPATDHFTVLPHIREAARQMLEN